MTITGGKVILYPNVTESEGVAVKEGKFIGPPMVKMAKNIMTKHHQIKYRK